MLATLADALVYAAIVKVELEQETLLNYDLVSQPIMTTVSDNKTYLSSKEKEVLGFHFSFHHALPFSYNVKLSKSPFGNSHSPR